MRVRISYGAEIEELPKITEELLRAALKQLWSSVETLERSLEELEDSENNFDSTISMINKARIKLSNSDLSLSDITAILDGLNNYYTNGEKNVPERRPVVDPSGDATNETKSDGSG